MACTARRQMDGYDSVTRKQRKPRPIVSHRLFPVIVALWFAALLGIGSFVVPPALLERLVGATGLPALLPAAAPPLGFTARAMVALTMTGIGALAGLLLALRLRGSGGEGAVGRRRINLGGMARETAGEEAGLRRRARDAHPDAPVRRPIAASEDLSSAESLGGAAFETSTGPMRGSHLSSDDPDAAPFAPPAFAALARGAANPDTANPDTANPDAERPLFAAHAVAEETVEEADFEELPAIGLSAPESPCVAEDAPPAFDGHDDGDGPAARREPVAPAPFAAPVAPAGIDSPVAGRPVEELGTVQLVERLALAMAARRAALPVAAPSASAPVTVPAFAAPFAAPIDHHAVDAADPVENVAAAPEQPAEPAFAHPAEVVTEPQAAPVFEVETEDEPEPDFVLELQQEVETKPEIATDQAVPVDLDASETAAPAFDPSAQVVTLRPPALEPIAPDLDDGDDDEPDFLPRFLGGDMAMQPKQAPASAPPFARPAFLNTASAASSVSVTRDEVAEETGDEGNPRAVLTGIGSEIDEEDASVEDGDGQDGDDGRFSSLLDISRPLTRAGFVCIEEPASEIEAGVEPVVVFPGQGSRVAAPFGVPSAPDKPVAPIARQPAKADSEETDRALRAALATLQRMTNTR